MPAAALPAGLFPGRAADGWVGSARGSVTPSLVGSWGRTRCWENKLKVFQEASGWPGFQAPAAVSGRLGEGVGKGAGGVRGEGAQTSGFHGILLPCLGLPLTGNTDWKTRPALPGFPCTQHSPPLPLGSCFVLPLYYHFLNRWGRKEYIHLPGRRSCRRKQVCCWGKTWHKRCFSKHSRPCLPPFNAVPLPS